MQSIGKEMAARAAARLCRSFPPIDGRDPEIAITSLIQVFSSYPTEVVEAALSPVSGLPSKHDYLPSIRSVVAECELHMEPIRRRQTREAVFERRLMLPSPPEQPKPTLEELQAKHGPNWGLDKQTEKPSPWLSTEAILSKYSISQAEWDAIPNAADPPIWKKAAE